VESKPQFRRGQPWAPCGFDACPHLGLYYQRDQRHGRCGHRLRALLFARDDENICFPYKELPIARVVADTLSWFDLMRLAEGFRAIPGWKGGSRQERKSGG